jgi:Zn-dependent M28 family amino/carboxypeptidase
MDAVRHLAVDIGPRHATSPAFRRAVRWVEGEFTGYGLEVRREPVRTPAGNSWGVDVPAGVSYNVVATPVGFDPARPHLVLGAHLDTVPVAPGAEDNASGVGTLLAVAEALQDRSARLPVVLVAFGAEEPRGTTDADHHYGSRHHVAQMSRAQRRSVRGMLAMDRVGVGEVVPICAAFDEADDLAQRDRVVGAARRAGVPYEACLDSASDHKSFARVGLPGVRLGSTPYAGYHSAGDVPAVVSRAQLRRTGRVALAWLGGS